MQVACVLFLSHLSERECLVLGKLQAMIVNTVILWSVLASETDARSGGAMPKKVMLTLHFRVSRFRVIQPSLLQDDQ